MVQTPMKTHEQWSQYMRDNGLGYANKELLEVFAKEIQDEAIVASANAVLEKCKEAIAEVMDIERL